MWLCFAVACSAPPKSHPPQPTEPDTVALIRATLDVTAVPGSSQGETQRAKDTLLARADAIPTLMREFRGLPADSVQRWHLIRLIAAGASRGDHGAIRFLLREALVPDPPHKARNGHAHRHSVASIGTPEEVMVKIEAAMGLVGALVAHAVGSAEAVDELLHESDVWLAKTVAMQMAHDHVMDQTYTAIMADRGLVHRFREATYEETRARTTTVPANIQTHDALPPRRRP